MGPSLPAVGARGAVFVAALLLAACAGDAATTTLATHLVSGYAHAGPTCPVESTPPDPACDDRPVPGAQIEVIDTSGSLVAEIETRDDGTFTVTLPVGAYTFAPQPVEGLMGTPGEIEVVVDGPVTGVDVAYDTGIR